jgi:hypothetical protein
MISKQDIINNPILICDSNSPTYVKESMGHFAGYPVEVLPDNLTLIQDAWDFLSDEQKYELRQSSDLFYLAWLEATKNNA